MYVYIYIMFDLPVSLRIGYELIESNRDIQQ